MPATLRRSPLVRTLFLDSGGGPDRPWIGFLFPFDAVVPAWGTLDAAQPWQAISGAQPRVIGAWLIAPRPPADPARTIARLRAGPTIDAAATATTLVWIADPDAPEPATAALYLAADAGGALTVARSFTAAFGARFAYAIAAGTAVSFAPDRDRLALAAGGAAWRIAGADHAVDDAGLDTLSAAAGRLGGRATAVLDPGPSGADVALYFYRHGGAAPIALRAPLLAAPLPPLTLELALDPTAPFDAARTRLTPIGDVAPLASGLRAPGGEALALTPRPGAGLAIAPRPDGSLLDAYLVLDGELAVSSGAIGDGVVQVGSLATESVAAPALTLRFVAGQPAYCPIEPATPFPTAAPLLTTGPDGRLVTAWIAIDHPVAYRAEPPEAPFYRSDPDLAEFLFASQPLRAQADLGLPAAPYLPLGLVVDADQQAALIDFDVHVLTAERRRLLPPAASPGLALPIEVVTNVHGVLVTVVDGIWREIALAATVDAAGHTHRWTIGNPGPAMVAAFAGAQTFVVASRRRAANGTALFALTGGLALEEWTLSPSLDDGEQLVVIKFATDSIATLAADATRWAAPAVFNADVEATQARLRALIAQIEAAASSAAAYAALAAALTSPDWNGVVAFGPAVTAAPPVVATIIATTPGGAIHALACAVAHNDVAGGGDEPPRLVASAPQAIVDYTRAVGPPVGVAFTFTTDRLRVGFTSGRLSELTCTCTLSIGAWFGVPVARLAGGVDAPDNAITLVGTYQRVGDPLGPTGPGTCRLTATAPTTFRFAYEIMPVPAQSTVLTGLTIAQLALVPDRPGGAVESRFRMAGSMSFAAPGLAVVPPPLAAADLFDYDRLGFVDLDLVMTVTSAQPTWRLDPSRTGFPRAARVLRPGLAHDLPLRLVRLVTRTDARPLTLAALRAQPLTVPGTWDPPAPTFDHALVYQLDLGRPGQRARTGPIVATLVVGWSAEGRYAVGLSLPSRIALQDVMPLSIGGRALVELPGGTRPRLALILSEAQLRILGVPAPPSAHGLDVALIGPGPGAAEQLLWFALAEVP